MTNCLIPWTNCHLDTHGEIHLCCPDWLPTSIGNVTSPESILAAWHGPVATSIRQSILDRSFRYCSRCPYLPGPRGPLSTVPTPATAPQHPPTLVLDYDNTCNLSCPSCRPKRNTTTLSSHVHLALRYSGLLQQTRRLRISGSGDVFASPLYHEIMREVPHINHQPDLDVVLHTNGQLLNPTHWFSLGPSRGLVTEIGISVDAGTENTYQENRRASWDVLWQNVRFARCVSPRLGFYYVVQQNNFRELPRLAELARSVSADFVAVIFLRNWGTYTSEEYASRAVHLPKHQDYAELSSTMNKLTKDPMFVLPTFPVRETIASTQGPTD